MTRAEAKAIVLDRLQRTFWKRNGGPSFEPDPISFRRRHDRIEYIEDETGMTVAMVLLDNYWSNP